MAEYTYEACLERSYRVNWRIEDVLAAGELDPEREWLPRALSGAGGVSRLGDEERRKLTHVEMASYAHLFGYAEEFVAPTVVELAGEAERIDRAAFDALTHFAAEEVKHMNLFRRVRDRIDGQLGFPLELLGGQEESVRFVMSKHRGAVLLLTACIEWFTQRHYRECFQDAESLDPFTRHLFKCHWLEESQHAQLDHLEALRAFARSTGAEADRAIDDLIELIATVDGWLVAQAGFDLRNFERYIGRVLTPAEGDEIYEQVLRAKRFTFLETGVTHPRFQELFTRVATPRQQDRVNAAVVALLPHLAEPTAEESGREAA